MILCTRRDGSRKRGQEPLDLETGLLAKDSVAAEQEAIREIFAGK